ncbi:MAG: hypothetical protein QOI74_1335 [Micromonosporaceae bacterium]|nr:hypothetical protein [Micromonosporaceae bacterium]MDT5038931.1 hypothetical protein [Micromonosporaceae bacterium]
MDNSRETTRAWHRASRCIGGDCLEMMITDDEVLVRDSKSPGTGALRLAPGVWADLLDRVRDGNLDRA